MIFIPGEDLTHFTSYMATTAAEEGAKESFQIYVEQG